MPTDVRSVPAKVISPLALPTDGRMPDGNAFPSVAMNVSPLFVDGVNVVGVENPGWNATLWVTI